MSILSRLTQSIKNFDPFNLQQRQSAQNNQNMRKSPALSFIANLPNTIKNPTLPTTKNNQSLMNVAPAKKASSITNVPQKANNVVNNNANTVLRELYNLPSQKETPEIQNTPQAQIDPQKQLRDAILSSLEPTEKEVNLMGDLVNLNESFREGMRGTADQRIPLTDIVGQQKSIEDRYFNRASTLKDTISMLQAKRLGQRERAETEFAFEQPKELNGVLYQRQPDGTYKAVSEKPTTANEGFTLKEGEVRYDQFGNVIATAPKTSGPSETSQTAMRLVNQLLDFENVGSITGLIQSPGVLVPGSRQQLMLNTFNQLRSLLSLENRQLLKGSGAISDYEARVLEKAATKLGRNLRDSDFINVLNELKTDLQGGGLDATGSGNVRLRDGTIINTNW